MRKAFMLIAAAMTILQVLVILAVISGMSVSWLGCAWL